MERKKVITIKVDEGMRKRIEEIVEQSAYLKLTKMDVVYSLLWAFFKTNKPDKDIEKIRSLVIEMRKKGAI